jgi:hypothetical protein
MNSYYENPIMNKSSFHEWIDFAIQSVDSDTKKSCFAMTEKDEEQSFFD